MRAVAALPRRAQLRRSQGGRPVRPRIARDSCGSLEAVAIDNVIEGSVRETVWCDDRRPPAEEASDAQVRRRLMTGVAGDEVAHAALSWRIDAWASSRLGAGFAPRRR